MKLQCCRIAPWLLFFTLSIAALPLAAESRGVLSGGKVSEHPAWFKESFLDIAEDVAEAQAANRHVMLFMHLNGCPYCYKMVEENIKDAPYTDFIREHFDIIALNIKGDREVALDAETTLKEKELAATLKVVYTPTILFLDADNRVVARVNGYRSVPEFKHVLDYVAEQAYTDSTLQAYLDRRKSEGYRFRDHPQLTALNDLSASGDKPLAVLFEDAGCVDCDLLHDGYLKDPEVQEILKNFTFVRFDALSDQPMVDVAGNRTTPRDYVRSLGLTYRPGIVLFDQGNEIMRIQSRLYGYHFREALRYVGERHYRTYPDSFYDYLDVRTEELLAAGQDVDIAR